MLAEAIHCVTVSPLEFHALLWFFPDCAVCDELAAG
jgi:hypothetical protein